MQRCLELAQKGMAKVSPNPMVGAILVHDGNIIGEGCHMQFGGPHAEVNCIHSVKEENRDKIKSSVLYVSLEPCSHHGKTPPCVDLILKQEIKEVVIACKDPNEKVSGFGIKKLVDAGVKVTTGIMEQKAIWLNRRFFIYHQQRRPYIILKWAQSSNFKIATADKKPVKISNEFTDRMVHRWRTEEDAIMVGTKTAMNDNPSLTARLWPGRNPIRIFIDRQLKIPEHFNLLDESAFTIIFNEIKQEKSNNRDYVLIDTNQALINQSMKEFYDRGIMSVIVEGGAILLQTFIDSGIWDEARVITNNNLVITDGYSAPQLNKHQEFDREQIQDDEIVFYKNNMLNLF